MQIVECLEILTMQVIEEDLIAMKVGKEDKSYVIDTITLDTLQGIVEHLMINAMEEIEGIYLHVSYAKILDIQKSLAKCIEEFLTKIKTLEEMEEEVLTV